jgi:glycosyltransferase involved in cell wall biosynthesis
MVSNNATLTGKIGIVMRTKDRNVLLKRAIESVLNQSYQNWQLVIVNDGGDIIEVDNLVAYYTLASAGRLRVFHNLVSMGMEEASNLGLGCLDAEMVIIHDDDDSWAPEFLDRMYSVYLLEKSKNSTVGGICCYCHRVNEIVVGNMITIVSVKTFNQHLDAGILPIWKMIQQNQMPPICFLFDLSLCRKIGGFDSTLPVLGDWDFHLRFMLENEIWILPESLAFYHHRVGLTGSLGNSVHAGVDKHLLYRKILENRWLRSDVKNGKFGVGSIIALSHLTN